MRALLFAVVVVMASLVLPTTPAAAVATDCAQLERIAHRGDHPNRVDENSMGAFQLSADRGHSIETDVWSDAQGQLWIFHDRNTLRATGVNGYIDKMSTAQVASLRYKKAGSPLPTLEEAMGLFAMYPELPVYIEVKQEAAASAVVAQTQAAGRIPTTWFTSYISTIRTIDEGAHLLQRAFDVLPTPANLQSRGVDVIMTNPELITTEAVDAYHAAGIQVQNRNSNSETEWRDVLRAGVDGQLTDLPAELGRFCPTALEPAVISGISPGSGAVGTSVTISGEFLNEVSAVTFGTIPAAFVLDSSTQITATVPLNAPATSVIELINPNGATSSQSPFVVPAPTLDSFSPSYGPPGSAVVLTGSGFAAARTVSLGSVSMPFTVDSATQITAVVPDGAPARGKIGVFTPSGSVQTATNFGTAPQAAAPLITSLSATTGRPGSTLVVTGSGFTSATTLKFGAASAQFTVDSDTQVTAVVPADVPGKRKVSITTPGGTTQSVHFFSVPPEITSIEPSTTNRGATMTIRGSAFTDATVVRFGPAPATFVVDSPTQISAVVPDAAPARAKITVASPGGSAASVSFYQIPPSITGFNPESGPAGGAVVITGSAFREARVVRFGSVKASFVVDSDNQITTTVPSTAPTSSPLWVVTPGGSTTSSINFTKR